MHGMKVLLGLSLLLATAYARPEGYGVKGGRNHKSSANAAAFAQASASANGGCSGIAQSSASATATANANASGGTSNAAATANAFANAGIGKAISCDGANENANDLDDSNDLRLSNNDAKELEKNSDKQENGKAGVGHHIAGSGSDDNTGSVGISNQNKGRRPGCGVPGVKGHRGGSKCSDKNDDKDNKPSVSNPYPTEHKNPNWSAGSKSPEPVDGGYRGNSPNSGSGACSLGTPGCSTNKPSVSNPYPKPDWSAGSKSAPGDGGYGENSPNSGSGACAPGTLGCSPNKPSVSNPYPTDQENPDLSSGSKSPEPVDGGYGGNSPNSGSGACAPGTSGCSPNKPSVSNPYPTYQENPNLSAGSKSPAPGDGGHGGNSQNSGSGACAPGTPGCSLNKPSLSNPYPMDHKNPDLSAGSKSPAPVDGGYGGSSPNSGSRLCPLAAFGCPQNKPGVSNPNPTQDKNPDWSAGSKSPQPVDSGYGGNSPNSGSGACTPGTPGCSPNEPSVPNPYPTQHGKPDWSTGSKSHPVDGSYGGNPSNSGSRPCAAGASGCSETKEDADSSPSSQHKVEIDYEKPKDNSAQPGVAPCYPGDPRCLIWKKPKVTTLSPPTAGIIKTGSTPCSSGATNCPKQWPGVSNPKPTYQQNPDLSAGSKHPTNLDGGYGGKAPTGGNKPGSEGTGYNSNPFLNGEIDVSNIKDLPKPAGGSNYPGVKPNPSNPFLNPHSQVRPPTGHHPETPNGSSPDDSELPSFYPNPVNPNGNSPGNSEVPTFHPNPANPFLSHGKVDSTSGVKHPGVSSGVPQGNSPSGPNAGSHPHTNGPNAGRHPNTNGPNAGSHPNTNGPNAGSHPNTNGPNAGSHPNTNGPNAGSYPNMNGPNAGSHANTNGPNAGSHPNTNGPNAGSYPNTNGPNAGSHPNTNGPNAGSYPNTNGPNAGSHPNTNGHKCQGTICTPVEPEEYPHGFDEGSKNPEYPSHKPNPSNPFLSHNGGEDKTGFNGHDNKDFGSSYKPGISQGKETSDSNPSSDNEGFIKPGFKPGSGCQGGISSGNCNQKDLVNSGASSSVTEGYKNGGSLNSGNQGVKTHQAGVKGGSRHRGQSGQLQGGLGDGKIDFVNGMQSSSYSEAHASASASAHSSAHASSSSYSSGGPNSSAKSEAYSDASSSGSSHSWASSSASASAFASSNSYASSGHWGHQIPEVPAE